MHIYNPLLENPDKGGNAVGEDLKQWPTQGSAQCTPVMPIPAQTKDVLVQIYKVGLQISMTVQVKKLLNTILPRYTTYF